MKQSEKLEEKKRYKIWQNNHEAIIAMVTILVIAGWFNVFSSTFVMAERDYSSPYYFLFRHMFSTLLGIVACLIAANVDYHKWRSWITPVTGLIILALAFVLLFGVAINGSKRWITLPFFSVQPAEFAKMCSIMLAGYYLSFRNTYGKEINIINRQYGIITAMALLVYLEPDMGTACIVIGIPALMMVVGGLKWRKLKWLIIFGLIALGLMCYMQPYRMQRIMVTYDPWPYAQDKGYQTVRSLTSIGSGGWFGMGIGQGLSKYDYLPEAHTDFAFAVFSQEMGFIVVLAVLFVYAAFCRYTSNIARQANDSYGQFLGIGILLLIGGQAVANLFMVSGMFPVVGVPLPFISYGGSSLIMSLFAVGILINISRQTQRLREKQYIAQLLRQENKIKRPVLRRVK
ncbi:MAG: putative lipid II flippase FtsW [Anaerovibrio sp.]|uniref:FtsW/RodA/SpoVE family cell cycle protein n=1 Tax=Anaerovibrio sp. TaxID=1872532 RepID=UPI0025F84F61|nr:putative peptidoglycan glycosyltransferase FtsW [Anaerovibrio sp.]MCR5176147.1 putative lipid II flippase FtsW [Anaerovibrio sp.]